ncbi:MAG: ATP phosphoribosyltransferase [bacterium]|nr:ATP phosphoribosyltransferase [bacterium]
MSNYLPKSSLTIAIAKGYLWGESLKLFESIGISIEDLSKTRRLMGMDKSGKINVLMVRPWDVATYVQSGAADLGIVGRDVMLEHGARVVDLIDLKFGGCDLVLAGPDKMDAADLPHNLRVGTKFVNSTEQYFQSRGLNVYPIKLSGAIELAPLTGLSDIICDLSATGSTLREHDLHVIDTVFSSTAHLVANSVIMKLCYDDIVSLVEAIKCQLPA